MSYWLDQTDNSECLFIFHGYFLLIIPYLIPKCFKKLILLIFMIQVFSIWISQSDLLWSWGTLGIPFQGSHLWNTLPSRPSPVPQWLHPPVVSIFLVFSVWGARVGCQKHGGIGGNNQSSGRSSVAGRTGRREIIIPSAYMYSERHRLHSY